MTADDWQQEPRWMRWQGGHIVAAIRRTTFEQAVADAEAALAGGKKP
jgi:hypothetical protein